MKKVFVVVLALGLIGSLGAQKSNKVLPEIDDIFAINPAKVKGEISIAGSSTVFPLILLLAEQFKAEGFCDQLTIDNIGSGAGLQRLYNAEVDLATASRKVNEKEKDYFSKMSRGQMQEYQIGVNALVILANAKLDFIHSISFTQAQRLFGTASCWSEVGPSWPSTKIHRYIPEVTHGTFDWAVSLWWNDRGTALKAASHTQRFQDYNQLIDNIDKDHSGIGFVGYGHYKKTNHSRIIAYENVIPSGKTVYDKSYKLNDYIFIYTSDKLLQDKPQVAAFLAFVLNNVNHKVVKAGFFPLGKELKAMKNQLSSTLKNQPSSKNQSN